MLLGFTWALVGILLVSAQQIITLTQGYPIHQSAASITLSLIILTIAALPIPISIAILRHNLYNIDRFINLSLVYGFLTIAIGAIYAVAVSVSQFIIQNVTGQHGQSQLALTVSTVIVAAIFQPVRRRIQTTIDRQFYRRRYDATQTIATFADSLRTEVDLAEITQNLIRVTHHTMHPRHVSLWLNQSLTHPSGEQTAPGALESPKREDTA